MMCSVRPSLRSVGSRGGSSRSLAVAIPRSVSVELMTLAARHVTCRRHTVVPAAGVTCSNEDITGIIREYGRRAMSLPQGDGYPRRGLHSSWGDHSALVHVDEEEAEVILLPWDEERLVNAQVLGDAIQQHLLQI